MIKVVFTIGEVADLLGITPKTIRYYHKIGIIAEPLRDANNYRYYTLEQIEELQSILTLKNLGLSLKQIKIVVQTGHSPQLIHTILKQHQQKIKTDILTLQNQLDNIQNYLSSDIPILIEAPINSIEIGTSTATILADSIRPTSNGLSDILIEVEGEILNKIDFYEWESDYEEFVHETGKHIAREVIKIEGHYIFWMERYLALASMDEIDLQGRSWLLELAQSPVRKSIAKSLQLPTHPRFSHIKQKYLQKLLLALLYQNNAGLQEKFLKTLVSG